MKRIALFPILAFVACSSKPEPASPVAPAPAETTATAPAEAPAATTAAPAQAQRWTCPMHHDVVMDAPGSCPKCGMTLVPMAADAKPATGDTPMNGAQIPADGATKGR